MPARVFTATASTSPRETSCSTTRTGSGRMAICHAAAAAAAMPTTNATLVSAFTPAGKDAAADPTMPRADLGATQNAQPPCAEMGSRLPARRRDGRIPRRLGLSSRRRETGLLRMQDLDLPRPDLFVAAMGRSGSTMLANLLTTPPRRWLLVEPRFADASTGRDLVEQVL